MNERDDSNDDDDENLDDGRDYDDGFGGDHSEKSVSQIMTLFDVRIPAVSRLEHPHSSIPHRERQARDFCDFVRWMTGMNPSQSNAPISMIFFGMMVATVLWKSFSISIRFMI